MCGRYAFFDEEEVYEARKILEDIAQTFGKEKAEAVKTGEIFPSETAAVILQAKEKPVADAVKWGYLLSGQKNLIINAKSETLFEKTMFRNCLPQCKCLIPAHAFFEWKAEDGKKVKQIIRVKERPLFYLCGLYADFSINGRYERRFVILTQPACGEMLDIHTRMPLIPPAELEKAWLSERKDVRALLEEIKKEKPELVIKTA